MFKGTFSKNEKVALRVVLRINKIQFRVPDKEVGKIFWVRAIIKRGSNTQKTSGYLCK